MINAEETADITAFRLMDIDLGLNAIIYGDKAYTHYAFEDYLQDIESIKLISDRKAKATRQHSRCVQYLQSVFRKRIETTFSQLVNISELGFRGQVGFKSTHQG